jgi:hypothetical protein
MIEASMSGGWSKTSRNAALGGHRRDCHITDIRFAGLPTEFVAAVAQEASAGGGETATGMLRDCDAAHAREVVYASSLELQPST